LCLSGLIYLKILLFEIEKKEFVGYILSKRETGP
jgi:hypothetical protein